MNQALQTTTTTVLLEGLLDSGNEAVWREFDARYRPIIVGFARTLGLDPDDAADVAVFDPTDVNVDLAFDHEKVIADYLDWRKTGVVPAIT